MNNTITLHKQDGASYRSPVKAYDLARNGRHRRHASDLGHGLGGLRRHL